MGERERARKNTIESKKEKNMAGAGKDTYDNDTEFAPARPVA